MKKQQREYKAALTAFRRSAGQIRRYHPDIDTGVYLSGVTTAKGVNKALNQLKFDVEQKEIAKRVAAYEERLEAIYEEMLKEESMEKFEEERDRARDSLNDNWGLDWDEDDYEEFWDTFGDSDLIDTYGSEQLIYIGERFIKERGELRPSKVAKIAKQTMNEISGSGFTQEQAIDRFNRNIERAIQKKSKKSKKGR